jgi:DNA-binding response OmpR family regulator
MAGARLLIVDDEEHIRDTMQFALEAVGYQTATAANGAEALEKFGAGADWDLVLLDQRMPVMEGLEVLRRMRERDPVVRVIMVTAYGTIDLAVEAMKSGAVDFLRKPFTPEVLRGAVKAALDHPRQPVKEEDLTLTRLRPPGSRPPQPLILFRTLNGYKYWPLPLPVGEEETEALRVRRAFEVKAPSGEVHRCVVELTTCVRELVRLETHQDYLPTDELWEFVCKGALADFLWTQAQLPPATLTVYELSHKQLEVVRSVAGLGLRVRR